MFKWRGEDTELGLEERKPFLLNSHDFWRWRERYMTSGGGVRERNDFWRWSEREMTSGGGEREK